MNILQVSLPKSGSFWLNTILKNSLEQNGQKISKFITTRPEYDWLKNEKLSFENQAGTDMIDIEENSIDFRVSSLLKEKIPNLQEYAHNATLAWTHSTYCKKTPQVFNLFDRKVCIVRDPRDTALSAAKFAFTPYMQKHYPTSYSSEKAFFTGEYERLLKQWVWFYGNYLLHRESLDLHFIFYENLLQDFKTEYEKLLSYLKISLTPEEKDQISKEVRFSSMKEDNPGHLKKGKSGKWMEQFTSEEKKTALEITGPLMAIFGYPLSSEEAENLPSTPENIPQNELEELLKKFNWRELY